MQRTSAASSCCQFGAAQRQRRYCKDSCLRWLDQQWHAAVLHCVGMLQRSLEAKEQMLAHLLSAGQLSWEMCDAENRAPQAAHLRAVEFVARRRWSIFNLNNLSTNSPCCLADALCAARGLTRVSHSCSSASSDTSYSKSSCYLLGV